MRKSSRDEENLSLIYECFVLKEDMDVGDVVGGDDGDGMYGDEETEKDARIPFIMGRVQTRTGPLKKKRRKKRRDSGVPRMSASISDMGPLGS